MKHPLLALGVCLLGFAILPASVHAAGPSLPAIEDFHRQRGREAAGWLMKQDLSDPDAVMEALMERRKSAPNYSLMQDGMQLCRQAAMYGREAKDPSIRQAASAFADALLRKHATPSGGFVEYERNTWLTADEMWRTIPWGTAFCGNRAFETWLEIKDDLSPEQRAYWQKSLENTGAWIYKSPVVGGYVFNNAIDLCGLLWRIGHEFDHPEWCRWALEAAEYRIRRDVDEEGWIQGENGGSSGNYQLFGASMLARFAWEAKTPVLEEATRRISAGAVLPYSTATMDWAGNYGTRVSNLTRVGGPLVLVSAALGDPAAAYCVQTFGQPEWSDDLNLWRAALATQGEAPTYPPVTTFRGITTTVVREGPWVAYFGNYDRSIWARGFMNLWHAGHGEWVFSTLHSCSKLSQNEKDKARLGDISDWAGFPHVRVAGGQQSFDSNRRIASLETVTGADGVTVNWTEPLLDENNNPGGEMRSSYRFHGEEIEMLLDLRGLAGESQLDFHFLQRQKSFAHLWAGKEVEDIFAGRFLRTAGNFKDRDFQAGETSLLAVQVDRTVFGFEVLEAPSSARLTLVSRTANGLHTTNQGGMRFRIAVPAAETAYTVKLRLKAVSGD
ncbi:MAG: hypothetical protein ACOY3P_26085 [Planctomycetota bacterium]